MFGFSVSYTTRAPRAGEIHGKNYFFVGREEFGEMIKKDAFIEYCEVHTNLYGTAKQQILDIQAHKKIPLLDIDVQGAQKLYRCFSDCTYVFICPPSLSVLKQRLVKRGTETENSLKTRVANAEREITECFKLDRILNIRIVNGDIDEAYNLLQKVVEAAYSRELGYFNS